MANGTNPLLIAALRYAELGYAVFPCARAIAIRSRSTVSTMRRPMRSRSRRGGRHIPRPILRLPLPGCSWSISIRSTTARRIPGCATNRRSCSTLSAAPTAITPRGGRHHVFRKPAGKDWRCSTSAIAPHIDIRTDGGYIVVAPSRRREGSYTWVRDVELDVTPDRLPEPPPWLTAALDRGGTTSPTSARVATGAETVNTIPSGQRNATLARLAGAMRRVGMSQGEISAALNHANRDRCVPPLSPAEVERIATSIARYAPDEVSVALAENHYRQMFSVEQRPAGPSDPGPFPEHLLSVPGLISEVVAFNLATAFRPQPVLALGAAIALLGTLTGRKVRDEINTRTNVYCLGVCPSGGGKERARQVNKEILFLAGAPEIAGPEGLASHAGLISAIEKHPASLFQLDEIGRLLRTLVDPGRSPHLYHIATNLMKLFTSSGTVYIGDAYADSKRNKVIHQPHACVYGTTVPRSLYEGLTSENVADGFLSRWMLFESGSEQAPKQRPGSLTAPDVVIATARQWLDFNPGGNLNGENPTPITVPTTNDAQAAFDELDRQAESEQQSLGEPLGTLWTRAVEKARKLALIYGCSRTVDEPTVDAVAAGWACDTSRYLTARLVFLTNQWVAENPFDAKRKRVLRMIRDAGTAGLTRSDLYGKTRAFTARERAEVLDGLLSCGDVVEIKEQTAGAPRVRYVSTAHAVEASS